MKGAPWFKFWVADFRGGTLEMTNAEVGAFIRLLLAQWEQGSLPGDPEGLAMVACGQVSQRVVSKFKKGPDGRLRSARMEKEREHATTRSRMGKEGAIARWGNECDAETMPTALPTALPTAMPTASVGQCPPHRLGNAHRIAHRNAEDRGQSTEDRGERSETENSSARVFSGHPLSAMIESLNRCQAVDGFPANRVGPMQWANVLQAFPVDDLTARAVDEFVVDCLTLGRWDERKSPISRLRTWIHKARKAESNPATPATEKPRGTWDLQQQIDALSSERDRLNRRDFETTSGREAYPEQWAKVKELNAKIRALRDQIAGKA